MYHVKLFFRTSRSITCFPSDFKAKHDECIRWKNCEMAPRCRVEAQFPPHSFHNFPRRSGKWVKRKIYITSLPSVHKLALSVSVVKSFNYPLLAMNYIHFWFQIGKAPERNVRISRAVKDSRSSVICRDAMWKCRTMRYRNIISPFQWKAMIIIFASSAYSKNIIWWRLQNSHTVANTWRRLIIFNSWLVCINKLRRKKNCE